MLGFLRKIQPVTDFEIVEHFGTGNHRILAEHGCVIARGLPEEVYNALNELLSEGTVKSLPFSPEIYQKYATDTDKRGLNIPLAEDVREYEEDHYIPVFFVTAEWLENRIREYKECSDPKAIKENVLICLSGDREQSFIIRLCETLGMEKMDAELVMAFISGLINDSVEASVRMEELIQMALDQFLIVNPDTKKAALIGYLSFLVQATMASNNDD